MIEIPTGGELYYQGQDLLKHDPQAQKLRRQKLQIVFQNPYGSLNPRKKVGQILEEPLLINSSPVSYTHLDVYKRQMGAFLRPWCSGEKRQDIWSAVFRWTERWI